MNTPAQAPPPAAAPPSPTSGSAPQAAQTVRKVSFKRRLVLWLVLLTAFCLLGLMAVRWAGSTTLRGTVERVYEKQAEYRVEFTELDGTVHVVGNQEIHFPFFKVDTADVQARLNRLAKTKDVVDLKIWGLRIAWFSLFPNIVDIDFVRSDSERRRAQASDITEAVIQSLKKQGVLRGGEGVRDELLKAVEETLKENPIPPHQPSDSPVTLEPATR